MTVEEVAADNENQSDHESEESDDEEDEEPEQDMEEEPEVNMWWFVLNNVFVQTVVNIKHIQLISEPLFKCWHHTSFFSSL